MSGSLSTYKELQESGVNWLGAIPSRWVVAKTGWYFKIAMGQTILKEELIDDGKWPVFSATDGDHYFGRVDNPTVRLNIGDIVIPARGNSIGSVKLVKEQATTTQTTIYCKRESQKLLPEFVFHYLKGCKDNLFYFTQTAIPQITVEEVSSNPILIPPLEEQKQIASFLDYETAKIDALIAMQQQLIALLGEKRQAVISHAVTKGLNPDAPMRDSGVQWLGQVPEHWDVRAISKCITKITNGYVGPTRDILVEEGVPYIQATHIKNGVVNFDNAYFVRQEWSDKKLKSILKAGDVLIVQTGAGTGDVGLVSENEAGYNCHALILLTSSANSMTGSYLSLALQSEYGKAVLFSIRTGGMHPHLNCGEVKFVRVPVPPLPEQAAIANHVAEQTKTFDQLEAKANAAVELLRERRTALISAAVTGKIDVRGWKPPAADPKKETEMEVA